jgi:hypothetical protein
MFGSNFDANFGIPQQQPFPFQGADSQGGLLGPNAAPDSFTNPGSAGTVGASPQQPPAQAAAAPPSAPPGGDPIAPHPTLSPLGGGPLSLGGAPNQATPQPAASPSAPAAGISSQFGGAKT